MMWTEGFIHPALILFLGCLVLPLISKKTQGLFFPLFPLAALWICWNVPLNQGVQIEFMQYQLSIFEVDRLSRIFGVIFSLITVAAGIFASHLRDTRQHISALIYAGSALGVVFAGDWITLFVFWEVMAISSSLLIWTRNNQSFNVGLRYLVVHLLGGSILLGGILWHIHDGGNIIIDSLKSDQFPSWLLVIGIGLNAAIPPLHGWLADAYPKATITGAIFLSALTTKSAVYLLVRVASGWEILIILGVVMAVYGVVYAVLVNDIREILSYHIISQVGYMVVGIGIGTQFAINGVVAHAVCHILYKALLFMGAGAVLKQTGKSNLMELGGLFKSTPLTFFLYMVGAFSISGFPLFNGFISKSMVISAAREEGFQVIFVFLILSSVGTFLHTGLKLPYYTWFGPNRSIELVSTPPNMYIAMGMLAGFCILFGVAPSILYDLLPYSVDYKPYTGSHLVESIQLISAGFLGFWWLRSKFSSEAKIVLDVYWIYRKGFRGLSHSLLLRIRRLFDNAELKLFEISRWLTHYSRNPSYALKSMRPSLEVTGSLILLSFILFLVISIFK